MAETPSIERNVYDGGRAGLMLRTPYDERFVAELKERLPIGDRWWNADRRGWWCAGEHEAVVLRLTLLYWPSVYLLANGPGGEDVLVSRDGSRVEQARLL